MAVANFFDKAALAAAQVLQSFNHQEFQAELEKLEIAIFLDNNAMSREGRVTAELSVNLLARLYPTLSFVVTGEETKKFALELQHIALTINPSISCLMGTRNPSAAVIVGTTSVSLQCPSFYCGSNAWIAQVSTRSPLKSGDSSNPFGAAAAACFACANVFRTVFARQLPADKFDDFFQMSLLDLQPNKVDAANPGVDLVDFRGAVLVGVGAIGNAAVWTLARFPNRKGTLNIVDPEVVELTNLQRYVLTTQPNVGFSKVALSPT